MGAQNTGYQAAAQSVSFTGTQTLLSLTDNEWTNLSDAIDNGTNKYLTVDIELYLASAAFTGSDSTLSLYLLPSVDGTNYPNWTGNVTTDEQENNQYYVCSFTTSGATEAQRMTHRGLIVPPGLYKYGVRNTSGVTLAASGNTLKWRPHSIEDSA